jgi:hypothetical protein
MSPVEQDPLIARLVRWMYDNPKGGTYEEVGYILARSGSTDGLWTLLMDLHCTDVLDVVKQKQKQHEPLYMSYCFRMSAAHWLKITREDQDDAPLPLLWEAGRTD